ncbi:MAG TPA: glycosyltransferase family 9 protein [Acidobacteriota bacterium]|nr:glycosyltransferase family 9 protein [Acidobacteriota bacterium]
MITPALNLLLSAYPDAELHVLTSREGHRVLRGYDPRLTRFLVFRSGLFWEIIERRRIRREIRKQQYSHAFVFEADRRFHRLLENAAESTHLLQPGPPVRHYSARCLSLIEQVLAEPMSTGWVTLPVTADGRRKAEAYFQANNIDRGACLVGFHTTFSQASAHPFRKREMRLHRRWPSYHFVRLAQLLKRHAHEEGIPLRLIMDVLPQERRLVEEIERGSGGIVQLIAAPPDFERYKAVLERMALLVTPDTGPMHIAAAIGTPLVALFSRKSPEDCGPFALPAKYRVLRAEDSPNPESGLAAITPEVVFDACTPFLAAWRSTISYY